MLCGPRRGCTEQPSGPTASQPACAAGTHSACRTVQIADVASPKCAASGRARRRHPSRAAAIASAASTLSGFSRTRRNIPVAYGAYRDAVAGRERPADVASLRHVLAPAPVAVVGAGGNPARTTRRRLPAPTAVTSGPGARCGTQSTACGPSGGCWWRTASMATTPPPPTTGTSSTSPGWAPDLGVGVSGVTRDLGNGHAMLEYLAPPGAARSSSGNRCPGRPPRRESRRSVPSWPPNMSRTGPVDVRLQSATCSAIGTFVNDIMA